MAIEDTEFLLFISETGVSFNFASNNGCFAELGKCGASLLGSIDVDVRISALSGEGGRVSCLAAKLKGRLLRRAAGDRDSSIKKKIKNTGGYRLNGQNLPLAKNGKKNSPLIRINQGSTCLEMKHFNYLKSRPRHFLVGNLNRTAFRGLISLQEQK